MAWVLTAGLNNLRKQVNARWPNRDKASDGSIGNTLHSLHTSGHNPDDTPGSKPAWNGDPDSIAEVRSWDMDNDLHAPGANAQELVDHIRRLPGVSGVLRYMIYNRRMYHSRDGWASTPYTGDSPHTEHIHFEGAWTQAADNNTTFNYRLDEVAQPKDTDMPLDTADLKKIQGIQIPVGTEEWTLGKALGYAARTSYEVKRDLAAFVTGEASRDSQVAATLAGMQTALSAIAAASGVLTPAQVQALTEQVRSAARQAGMEATAEIAAKVDALREHLGDDAPAQG